jgi:hypothetical protein
MTEPKGVRLLADSDAILGVRRPDGTCDAFDFISGLTGAPRARFRRYFEYLRDGHYIKSPENMRHLETDSRGNQLHELKIHTPALRVYLVKSKSTWVITHGVKKVKDKLVPREISKAWDAFYLWQSPSEKGD